jgi:hypothetical protein
MLWKVDNELRIEPPIQTKNFLSCGAKILTLVDGGHRFVISLFKRSEIPGNIVVPPLKTILEKSYFLISTSDFMTD